MLSTLSLSHAQPGSLASVPRGTIAPDRKYFWRWLCGSRSACLQVCAGCVEGTAEGDALTGTGHAGAQAHILRPHCQTAGDALHSAERDLEARAWSSVDLLVLWTFQLTACRLMMMMPSNDVPGRRSKLERGRKSTEQWGRPWSNMSTADIVLGPVPISKDTEGAAELPLPALFLLQLPSTDSSDWPSAACCHACATLR